MILLFRHALLAVLLCTMPAVAQTWQSAVAAAARATPAARILVLDIAANRILAASHLDLASRTLAAPGSTLKPIALYQLLARKRWDPAIRVPCNGDLTIAGRSLACSHAHAPPFDARQALTWSCNAYFARVAQSLRPGELDLLLRPTGLFEETHLARSEATAEFRSPRSPEENQLAFLGVDGIRITPLELAAAYRWLAREFAAHSVTPATATVRAGLSDSASFGIGSAARLGGVAIAGKTGTAEGTASPQTHGWFAGLAPADHPQVVVVVYLPAGRGADAAGIAGILLARSPLERP